jgi:4-hydroxy-tetrahydrodipicolinate reductase
MGSLLADYLASDSRFTLLYGVDPLNQANIRQIPVFSGFPEGYIPDVIIDFSHPSQIHAILDYAKNNHVALVIATTGYNEAEEKEIVDSAKLIPIFKSANLSYGIQIAKKMLESAVPFLKDYDIEMIETHHKMKADAPSGTAKMLVEAISDAAGIKYQYTYGREGMRKRKENEIGIHSVRLGSIVGNHSVIIASDEEIITITHQAQSKAVFVQGAIRAALYIVGKEPGLYAMDDLTATEKKEGDNHAGIE